MTDVYEVFTPNDVPTFTYVDRSALNLESQLRDGLSMRNMVVSLSGPSKSGKTVLVQKVLESDLLIPVSGAAIKTADDLWDHALQWMGTPASISASKTTTTSIELGASAGGEAGVPLVAKGKTDVAAKGSTSHQNTVASSARAGAFQQVIKEIGGSDYVIFIDDFHYIDRAVQLALGRQIKAIAENGVRICAASVPHRVDDIVRSNPELSGRVASVKMDYWDKNELAIIAQKGFPELGIDLANSVIERLTSEAFGIPQLMQSLCLNLCLELDIRESGREHSRIEVSSDTMQKTLDRTSNFADYSSIVQGLHSGPKVHGTERKAFDLIDGSSGDVYRCVLMAIREDPPTLSFPYDDMMSRVKKVCAGDSPVGSSVTSALHQMQGLSKNLSASVPIIEWNEDVLEVVEPYFLFFLRASQKLKRLGKVTNPLVYAAKSTQDFDN